MKNLTRWLAVYLVVGFSSTCFAGTVGVFAHADATGCAIDLPQGQATTIYVVGLTTPDESAGGYIASGEFRIIGMPPNWVVHSTAQPNVHLVLGNAFEEGAFFAFAELQAGLIPLLEVQVLATSEVSNVVLRVTKHVDPSPPFGDPIACPWFRYCDNPCDTSGTCVEGVSFFINASGCEVAVDRQAWSTIKGMYE